jgi:hypothetical protein
MLPTKLVTSFAASLLLGVFVSWPAGFAALLVLSGGFTIDDLLRQAREAAGGAAD